MNFRIFFKEYFCPKRIGYSLGVELKDLLTCIRENTNGFRGKEFFLFMRFSLVCL